MDQTTKRKGVKCVKAMIDLYFDADRQIDNIKLDRQIDIRQSQIIE